MNFTGNVTCSADTCEIRLECGALTQVVTLRIADAESIAKLILERCAEAKKNVLVVPGIPGLKS